MQARRRPLALLLPHTATVPNDSPVAMGQRSVFIDETAAILGVSRRTVYYRIREGRLRTIRTRGGSQRVLLSSIETLRREMQGAVLPAEGVDANRQA